MSLVVLSSVIGLDLITLRLGVHDYLAFNGRAAPTSSPPQPFDGCRRLAALRDRLASFNLGSIGREVCINNEVSFSSAA